VEYRHRVVDATLDERLPRVGAILLEGPKSCGKTETASRRAASEVRLDTDETARQAAQIDPGLVLGGDRPCLIDEWQLFPRVWDHVRRAVDDSDEPGQFLLTGSSVPADDARRHSGAGRVATIRMRPMSLLELGIAPGGVSLSALFEDARVSAAIEDIQLGDLFEQLVLGGWPPQLNRPDPAFAADYVNNTAHVDINRIVNADGEHPRRGRDPDRVMACLRSLARNTATAAGVRTIAADTNLARPTVDQYLDALARLLVTEDLPAFNTHLRSSRNLRTTPKRHFVDPSIATGALNIGVDPLLKDLNYAGLLLESLVVRDLRVLSQPLRASVTYFHNDDHEIDVIVQRPDGAWGALEVKLGGQDNIDGAARSLRAAVDSIDQDKAGPPSFLAVVTAVGAYSMTRPDGVHVIPLRALQP